MTEERGSRFSLPAGDGAGAMLGLAAGDTAGGDFEGGYAASTQQAIVVAYHLFRHGRLDRDLLGRELIELDGDEGGDPSVYRCPSPGLTRWLKSVKSGEAEYGAEPSLDPAVRVAPVGMWFRERPQQLIKAALETSRLTHLDGPSAVMATAVAAAVAAGCFAQNGRDLVMAVKDVAGQTAKVMRSESLRYSHIDGIDDVVDRLARGLQMVGADPDDIAEEFGSDPIGMAVTGLLVGAPVEREPYQLIETAARIGGSPVGAITGAVVGARVGIRRWPWTVPNDTWFVAIGQRLVVGRTDLVDLPVPYAVEQRLTYEPHPQPI